jgi:hypothetical protein
MGSCGGVAVVLQNQLLFFKHKTGNLLLSVVILTTSLGMTLVGVGLAIAGLMQADGKKVLAELGLFFNGLFLLGVLGLLVRAL